MLDQNLDEDVEAEERNGRDAGPTMARQIKAALAECQRAAPLQIAQGGDKPFVFLLEPNGAMRQVHVAGDRGRLLAWLEGFAAAGKYDAGKL